LVLVLSRRLLVFVFVLHILFRSSLSHFSSTFFFPSSEIGKTLDGSPSLPSVPESMLSLFAIFEYPKVALASVQPIFSPPLTPTNDGILSHESSQSSGSFVNIDGRFPERTPLWPTFPQHGKGTSLSFFFLDPS